MKATRRGVLAGALAVPAVAGVPRLASARTGGAVLLHDASLEAGRRFAEAYGSEALYLEHCASCHAPNGMGTGLLARRVQPALLEARGNLPAAYVTVAVRQGVGNMPAIPRGEVSDDELRAIAAYLAAGPHPAATGVAQ